MTLSELSIKRYAMAYMMNLVIVLIGVVSVFRVGVDRYPSIDFPIISVTTILPGANPEVIDTSVTNIIESAVNSVPGIDYIQASSTPSASNVIVFFKSAKDMDIAFNEVQSKVNVISSLLPTDAKTPIIRKIEFGAFPIMWVVFGGDRTPQQLDHYMRTVVKKRVEGIEGVGNAMVGGSSKRAIRINVDLERLSAFGLTANDLVRAIKSEHLQFPGGYMVGENREMLIKLDQEYHSIRELRTMVVGYREGAPIKLKDVANVEDALEDIRAIGLYKGQRTTGLGIVKISTGNIVAISEEVQRVIKEEIEPNLPPGMWVEIATDDSIFIKDLVANLEEHILWGTLLAALVVLVFLHDWRSTLIVATAIPVSLLGAVAVMYFADFTFNSFTMLALLLLIGVVVDDAIVVLENIHRHRNTIDKNPVTSAISGSNEVFFAIFASSLSLISIFGPVIFMSGVVGKFFQSFAVVVSFGVIVSFFVSITLTPMLCSRFLKSHQELGLIARFNERWITGAENFYKKVLGSSLTNRWKVLALATVVVLSSGFFFNNINKGFNPDIDEGKFMVFFKTPMGSTIDYGQDRLKKVLEVLENYPEVVSHFSGLAMMPGSQSSDGMSMVRMTHKTTRDRGQYEIQDLVQADLNKIPGIRAFVTPMSPMGGGRADPLQVVLRHQNFDKLAEMTESFRKTLENHPDLGGNVDVDLQVDLPQIELKIDRVRASSLGLAASDVSMAVNTLLGGSNVAYFNDKTGDQDRYDIRIKAKTDSIGQPSDLKKLYLRSRTTGELVRADTVAKFEPSLGPAKLSKFSLQYAATFYATPTIPIGDALAVVEAEVANLPPGFSLEVTGQARSFGEAVLAISFALIMALLLMYMVLASQFNGFVQPMIVMMAQPLAIVGGLAALWLFDSELVIYSMIGMVLLMGLVAKNSILLVDLTNQYRDQGMSIDEALLAACPTRFRPVVMTSLTLILAMTPAALSTGGGSETNLPLALMVIGGMISSTLMTLVVVPALYSLLENFLARFANRRMEEALEADKTAPHEKLI